jgi:hypothetical protein
MISRSHIVVSFPNLKDENFNKHADSRLNKHADSRLNKHADSRRTAYGGVRLKQQSSVILICLCDTCDEVFRHIYVPQQVRQRV